MATTTNFGWETPDDTDLVKDGAAAMRTLGNAIDTSFVDLKGGTTGQVLAKASNTDLDFTWATDASGISATIFDAKGDLIAASAADTAARLAVGTNGHVLTADSTTATGLKWAAVDTAPKGYTLLNTGGTALTGATTVTYSGISNQASLLIYVLQAGSASASSYISLRINGDTAANYVVGALEFTATDINLNNDSAVTSIKIGRMSTDTASWVLGSVWIDGANSTDLKVISAQGMGAPFSGSAYQGYVNGGVYKGTSAVTSVSLVSSAGNFDSGTMYVYGKAV